MGVAKRANLSNIYVDRTKLEQWGHVTNDFLYLQEPFQISLSKSSFGVIYIKIAFYIFSFSGNFSISRAHNREPFSSSIFD